MCCVYQPIFYIIMRYGIMLQFKNLFKTTPPPPYTHHLKRDCIIIHQMKIIISWQNIPSGDMTFDKTVKHKIMQTIYKANVYGYHKNRHKNLKPNKYKIYDNNSYIYTSPRWETDAPYRVKHITRARK